MIWCVRTVVGLNQSFWLQLFIFIVVIFNFQDKNLSLLRNNMKLIRILRRTNINRTTTLQRYFLRLLIQILFIRLRIYLNILLCTKYQMRGYQLKRRYIMHKLNLLHNLITIQYINILRIIFCQNRIVITKSTYWLQLIIKTY